MDIPRYPFKPIRSLKALSLALGEPAELLVSLAARSSRMYRHVPQQKKDGSRRDTFDAYEPLKVVQRKIVDRLLVRIAYPTYLHGGIRDRMTPRSIYSNARLHAGARAVILQDIKDFYPSITIRHVRDIFKGLMGFSEEVASVLADLTTRDGVVPQGASTSSYLANLVFWDIEPTLVARLSAQGIQYSRFADDITISCARFQDSSELSRIVASVTQMLAAKGCYQKRSKMHFRKRGQTIKGDGRWEPLTVTGLAVHNALPGIPKNERKAIRAAVKQLEEHASRGRPLGELEPKILSAMGRIGRLIACGHVEGQQLMQRVREVKNAVQATSPLGNLVV